MKRGLSWIAIAAMAGPCAAATAPAPQNAAAPDPSGAQPQPLYKSIWRVSDKDAIVHLQSGLSCDSEIGTFRRVSVHIYKPTGLDVSCNYLDAQKSLITLYMTRRESNSLADDFTEAERGMLQYNPDASPLSPPSEADGLRSALFKRTGGTIKEGIWIGDVSGWTLEYRATWTRDDDATVLAEIAALTARVRDSAGAQLGLCAKQPAPVRDGVLVTDQQDIEATLMSQTIVEAAAESAGTDKEAAAGAQPVWCAESIIGESDDAMLLWRAVNADGTDAETDRITPFALEDPDVVTSSIGPTLAKILGELNKGMAGKQRWAVTFVNDKGNWTLAFYDGRPDGTALLKIGNDIRYHRAKALGGYSVKDKKITITVPEKN